MGAFKKLMDYIKERVLKKDKNKLIENSLIVLIAGAIILIAASSFFKDRGDATKKQKTDYDNGVEVTTRYTTLDYSSELEKNLASILSKIEGAGKVDVMITYFSGSEIVPAYEIRESENNSTEKDSAGGTREVNQYDYESKIAYEDEQNGGKKPVIIKNIYPTVKGVVVVAEGAKTPSVKQKLLKAVEVLMDIPVHKIQVLERAK